MNGSRSLLEESSESNVPSSCDRPSPQPEQKTEDPLERLEELLDSENFDDGRISVIQIEPAPKSTRSDRVSLMKDLRKKHPRVAFIVAIVVASAVWAKVFVDALDVIGGK